MRGVISPFTFFFLIASLLMEIGITNYSESAAILNSVCEGS